MPYTRYEVKVKVITVEGYSAVSDIVTVTTKPGGEFSLSL